MVAVKTGFSSPSMPGMPAPMQPMGGLPPMPPMGGPGTFPAPQGGNPFAPLPPMPLAGMPPPMGGPGTFPVAPNRQVPQQQGSNAPRRKRFGDSLESMLGRNQGLGATAPQRRPLPMPQQQQRMVAPGVPMMATPTPRPMEMGGEVDIFGYEDGGPVQYMDEGGLAVLTLPDGNAYIDFGGGAYHHVSPNQQYPGLDLVDTLQDAYGDRIGEVRAADQGEQDYIFAKVDYGKGQNLTEETSDTTNTGVNNSNTAVVDNSGVADTSSYVDTSAQSADTSVPASFENAALFGPVVRDTPSYSQFVQNPTTGAITTTGGNTMTAVSPIGSIDLPAAPVGIGVSDYLSDPVFGTMGPYTETPESCAAKGMQYDPASKLCVPMTGTVGMEMGGAVPMQTSIAGQPHMLSYINQDEEALLRSFGGSGIAGPGGIPSYPPSEYSAGQGSGYTTGTGSSNFDSGYTSSASKRRKKKRQEEARLAAERDAALQQVIDTNSTAAQQTPSDKMSFGDEDYTPTSAALNQQLSGIGATNITTNFSPVDYTTTASGNNYDTAAQADRDLSGFDYVAAGGLGSGNVGVSYTPERISLGSDDPVVFTDVMGRTYNNAADRDRANLGYQQASYQQGKMPLRGISESMINYPGFGDADAEERMRLGAKSYLEDPVPPSTYNYQNTPDIFTNMFNQPIMPPILPPKIGGGDDKDDSDLDRASKYDNLLALERDFAPGEGGYSLVDLKERISLAEGTSDAGGYDRLLGGQETKNFKIKPTEMTVQEILDFQLKRGEGSYAEYANSEVGRISTPVGKYQVVGSTLQGLVDQGIVDPNEKFDENTQERIGTHLITTDLAGGKGLEDLKTGDMTIDEFETALGKQFEGIQLGYDELIDKADEGPASDIDILDPDNKEELKSLKVEEVVPPKTDDEITVTTLPKPAEKVEQITEYTDKDGKTTVDNTKTPQNEAVIAQLGLGSSVADVAATGRDIGVPNAAESAFLMEALNEMEFDDKGKLVGADPNFLEETMGKIIKNLTLGAFDPNDPQKGEDAKAILDAYQKTGKFVYDGKEMSLTELIKASKEEGIEPAVIGVEGADKTTVGFDDGTGFRNIMGDYDPVFGEDGQVFSGGSDTQNILTGDTDVFGGNTNTNNTATAITTGGGDDGGSDGGSDTDVDTGHTTDKDGNKVCNTEGYIYNPETKICEKKKVEEDDKDLSINVMRGEDFDDVLGRVTTAAPNIGSIAGNVKPMQEGGMVGLNRAADNFLQALAG